MVTGTGSATVVGMLAAVLSASGARVGVVRVEAGALRVDLAALGGARGAGPARAGSPAGAAASAERQDPDVLVVELAAADLAECSTLRPQTAAVLDVSAGVELSRRAFGPGTLVAHPREDAAAGRLAAGADARVAVTVGSPRAGELGVVEDLLVDRAFPDVVGEATVVAGFADLPAPTPEVVLAALLAAALARSYGVPADAVAAGLRAYAPAERDGAP